MKPPRISLDQWLAFKTVVDSGSYAMAAEALNKSQSSISYAINRLNQQLPQPVLALNGRKAVMTEAGQVLYRYAEQLLRQSRDAEAVAASLAMGFEAEVIVALDALLNIESLICAFEQFSQQFPHTRIRVLETSLSGTSEALLEAKADLVLGPVLPTGFSGTPLMQISMLPVVAPGHPLLTHSAGKSPKVGSVHGPDVSELELRAHRQVVLRDTGARREQDAGWLQAEQRWTVSHFSSSIALIKSGLAFGFLPRNWIDRELAAGELVQIPLQQNVERVIPLYLMLADRHAAGPATKALHEIIVTSVQNWKH
jgi:DNA-binding transcriptional LysR family regulator